MKLIVGLGNIGEKYVRTRHNAGFVLADKLFEKTRDEWQISDWQESKKFFGSVATGSEVILLKPSTFMNESGKAVSAVSNFYKIKCEDIYVIYDDLDIKLGEFKIQLDKGPKVHNGLSSVREKLGTNMFWHVRVGVENREVRGNVGIPGVEYSLQNFSPDETKVFGEVVAKLIDQLVGVVS